MFLVVRSAPALPATLARLADAGYPHAVGLPISDITLLAPQVSSKADYLVFTSANAVHPGYPKLPVVAVGDVTAEAAAAMGHEVFHVGNDDGGQMASSLLPRLRRPATLLHLHGDTADLGWHRILAQGGHTVLPVPAYRTAYLPALPEDVRNAFAAGAVRHVLLFSEGGAKHLRHLLAQANMPPWPANIPPPTVLALSPKVAEQSPFPHPRPCPNPSLRAMLGLLAANPSPASSSSSSA